MKAWKYIIALISGAVAYGIGLLFNFDRFITGIMVGIATTELFEYCKDLERKHYEKRDTIPPAQRLP